MKKKRSEAKPSKRKFTPIEEFSSGKDEQEEKARLFEDLEEFELFRQKIIPAIRKDLLAGMSAAELRAKYAALVQARIITDAITTPDAGKASTAAKDVLDRTYGKATEKKEVTHKFADLPENELDAILESELKELGDLDADTKLPN